MSDLISRSELLKRFCINKDGHRIPERDCDNFEVTVSIKDVKTIVKEQPTTYDVDKVIEELEERSKEYNSGVRLHGKPEEMLTDDAIEIVKQGSVADDVCEWKSASDGEFIQNPHTKRLYSNEPSMQNVYCNTCGKKIKVVE